MRESPKRGLSRERVCVGQSGVLPHAVRSRDGREESGAGRPMLTPSLSLGRPVRKCAWRGAGATERHSGDNRQVLGWGREAMSTGEGQVSLHWRRGVTGPSPCWEAGHGQ